MCIHCCCSTGISQRERNGTVCEFNCIRISLQTGGVAHFMTIAMNDHLVLTGLAHAAIAGKSIDFNGIFPVHTHNVHRLAAAAELNFNFSPSVRVNSL